MSLTKLRATLTAALTEAGLSVYDYLPPQVHPPVVLIEPADPYIEAGETFGELLVSLDLYVVTRKGTGLTQTRELDGLIETVIRATDDTEWALSEVGRPYALTLGGSSTRYLAATVTVQTHTRL